MRVVLDTNVLVSALIKSGKPRELIFKMVEREAQLVLSRNILEEFLGVADDQRIRRYVDGVDIIAFLKVLGNIAKIVRVESRFKAVDEDPDDDLVLRTAKDGKAEYVVSGDRHLLSLRDFKGIKIVTADEMLKLM